MKKYTTNNFFKQVLLSNIDGIKIVDFKNLDKEDREEIEFEFEDSLNKAVNEILSDYKKGKFIGAKIDGFENMKIKRKELIKEFKKRQYDKKNVS